MDSIGRIIALIEAALCVTYADEPMLEIYRVIGQVTLKYTFCGIVHHARRTELTALNGFEF